MKVVALTLFLAAIAAPAFADTEAFPQFLDYIKTFNKKYETTAEFDVRFHNFKASLKRIAARNDTTFGINKFSDMSTADFKAKYLGYRPSPNKNISNVRVQRPVTATAPPLSFDWRNKGAVSAVKNQQQCGSCWAFSATEEIESMNYLKTGQMKILAPQQIVSCDTTADGCNGGDTRLAYEYVKQAGGIEYNKDYPYTSGDGNSGRCKFNSNDVAVKIDGYTYATNPCYGSCNNQDFTTLKTNLASKGPVSICVYAESWQDYTSGVLTSNCPHGYDDLDHCVQLTGYDDGASNPYWWVRNSWGADWGVQGYIKVQISGNVCGVADEATFATIA